MKHIHSIALYLSFLLVLASRPLSSQAVHPSLKISRGPYLQQMTPRSVLLKWRTDRSVTGKVWIGTTIGNPSIIKEEGDARANHEIFIDSLTPDTKYYYAIGHASDIDAGNQPDYFFITAPEVGTEKEVRVWLLGDCGTGNANARAVRDAYEEFLGDRYTDLVFLLGDNAYSTGTDEEYQKGIFDMYTVHLRKTCFWSCPGNHEFYNGQTHSGSESGPYYDIFSFPRNGEAGGIPSGTEAYYSFDYANIHFISLDSHDSRRTPGSPMLQWLENDLASTHQKWIIVVFHHPPYTHGSHNSDNPNDSGGRMKEMREYVLPILDDYGVDLVLSGHSHAYERSTFIKHHYGESDSFDPSTMLIDGGDGRIEGDGAYMKPIEGDEPNTGAVYVVAGSAGKASGGDLHHPVMYYSEGRLGSAILDVQANTLKLRFLRSTGVLVDSFTMIKDGGLAPKVKITTPVEGALFTNLNPIPLEAMAEDLDGSVDKVDFYANDKWIDVDSSAPYSVTWIPKEYGAYKLIAKATDNDGTIASSAPVHIRLNEGNAFSEEFIIQSGDNDVEEGEKGNMYINSSDLELVYDSYKEQNNQTVGLRFTQVTIPPEAIIDQAYLQFTVDEKGTAPTELDIHIQNSKNAPPFSSKIHDVSQRPTLPDQIHWSPPAWNTIGASSMDQQSPDLTQMLQKIIDKPDWQSGASVVFTITGMGTRTAVSYDGSSTNAPVLHVEYRIPSLSTLRPFHTENNPLSITASPNPTHASTNLKILAPTNGVLALKITNNKGATIFNGKIQVQKGVNTLRNFSFLPLSKGIYFIHLKAPSGKEATCKVLKI